jgi:hypothetical protein
MTTSIVLNLIFAAPILATIVGLLAWAIATQSRDDGPLRELELPRQTVSQGRRINRGARRPSADDSLRGSLRSRSRRSPSGAQPTNHPGRAS